MQLAVLSPSAVVVDFFPQEIAYLPKGKVEVACLVAVAAPYAENFAVVYLIDVVHDD